MARVLVPTCELRVVLDDVRPPIWRTLVVPADIGLDGLHCVLQVAMGWTDTHLHQFRKGEERFAPPDPDGTLDHDINDEGEFCIAELLQRPKQKITYEYDFGDGWSHTITLVAIRPEPCPFPRCLDGQRACPPEDCGGPGGYAALLDILADPKRADDAEMLQWYRSMVSDDHDPAVFPIDDMNACLAEGIEELLDAHQAQWGDEGSDEDAEDEGEGRVIRFPGRN